MATTKAVLEVPLYQDVYRPVLKSGTPSLHTTDEQNHYIKEILDICCSDSRFAQKAYDAILYILSQEEVPVVPAITSLEPATAVVGSGPVSVAIHGTEFSAASLVLVNGSQILSSFVSDTEITASLDTSAEGTQTVEVSRDQIVSNSMDFTVTAVVLQSTTTEREKKVFPPVAPVGSRPTLERK